MKTFLISDTHFGHHNMYKFTDSQGNRIRDLADDAIQGDAIMVDRWNSVVSSKDKIYHLGDVAIPRKGLKVLKSLNGRKILIKGNHDIFKLKDYIPYFDDIRGMWKLDNFILTHYPIHPGSIPHWCCANIHGHIHQNVVDDDNNKYINVSVEQINYTPIDFQQIKNRY